MGLQAKIKRINDERARLQRLYLEASEKYALTADHVAARDKPILVNKMAGLDLALGILHSPDGDESEPAPDATGESVISVGSIYGHDTQRPYVELFISGAGMIGPTQMDPATARKVAGDLFASAEAAESDAFIMDFFRRSVKVDDPRMLAGLLIQFREWRDRAEWAEDAGNEPGDPPMVA